MIRRFNRYELKYVLPYRQYQRILKDFEGFLKTDTHAGENGIYRISSLYYDSPDLSCYRNKIDGIKYRRKLRLRIYKDSDLTFGFVEIKQRINRTVQKRRLCLPIAEAKALCAGQDIGLKHMDSTDAETASEVIYLVKSQTLKPQCIISYHRRAYEGSRYEHGLRVTFDTHLKYRRNELDVTTLCKDRFFLTPDKVVMEVKANEQVPTWLTSLFGLHQCSLQRVSKYCLGIDAGEAVLQQSRIQL
jgi:SPX domain protein involved in polyphosphate accumulation